MGVWSFIFDHDHWKDIYAKNCSLKSRQEWYEVGHSLPIGLTYAGLGLFCEIFYIPFLVAMLQKEFIQLTCYKLMFLIGVFDLMVLPFTAMTTGMQIILGAHYCTNPTFFFWAGCISTCGWYLVSLTSLILAIDRFLIMSRREKLATKMGKYSD